MKDDRNPDLKPRDHRRRVLKAASILQTIADAEISCSIRNVHEHGAELELPANTSVPKQFLLYVPQDQVAYEAVLRWRNGKRVGVGFTGRQPKPAWHYGRS